MRNLEFLHLYQKGCVGKGEALIFKKGQGVRWVGGLGGLGGMVGGIPSWGTVATNNFFSPGKLKNHSDLFTFIT